MKWLRDYVKESADDLLVMLYGLFEFLATRRFVGFARSDSRDIPKKKCRGSQRLYKREDGVHNICVRKTENRGV